MSLKSFKSFLSFFLIAAFAQANVLINEIMYNPAGDDDFEWVELYNSDSNSVPLNGWKFTDGIKFTFNSEHDIPGNGYLVIARDPAAFTSAYPHVECAGDYKGKLSNKGEKIILKNSVGQIVDEVEYKVDGAWPQAVFNGGATLERVTFETPAKSMADWKPSHNNSAWYLVEKTLRIRRPQIKIKVTQPCQFIIDNFKITTMTGTKNLFLNGDFESEFPPLKFSSSYFLKSSKENHNGKTGLEVQAIKKSGRLKMFLPEVFDKYSRYRISFWVKPVSDFGMLKLYVSGNKPEIINLNYERKFGGTPGAPNSNFKSVSGPVISSLEHFPFFPQLNSDVTINTIVENATSNTEVNLFYKKGLTGEFSYLKMLANITNSTLFSTILKGLEKNDYYDYYVEASCNPPLKGGHDRAGGVIQGENSTRYPCEFDFPNIKRCYSLEIKNKPEIPVVAFWLDEKKPGKRNLVSRGRYKSCDVAINNKIYHDAKVRYRGAHSFRHGIKKSYNLKFSRGMRPAIFDDFEYENGAVLNAMAFDYSFLREKLSLELFRRAGAPASDNYYVRGYKNGSLRGLFLFMERVNGDFIEKKALNENGAIISPERRKGFKPKACKIVYEKNNFDGLSLLEELYADLVPLPRRDINSLTIRKGNFITNFFIEKLINFTAVNVIVQKRDGIVANFYAYCDAHKKKWQMIPWDHDFTWGLSINGFHHNDRAISPFYGSRRHSQAVRNYISPINDALFWPEVGIGAEITENFRINNLTTITNIIAAQLTSGKLEEFVDSVATSIQYEAELEIKMRNPRGNSIQVFNAAIRNLKSSMKSREKYLLQECEKYLTGN